MDKYDEAVAYLKGGDIDDIDDAWGDPDGHQAGCLFQFCGDPERFGCLTQVRGGMQAPTDELTRDIRNDHRIPTASDKIRKKHLPVFAEWQRRIDAMGVR